MSWTELGWSTEYEVLYSTLLTEAECYVLQVPAKSSSVRRHPCLAVPRSRCGQAAPTRRTSAPAVPCRTVIL